MQLNLQRPFPYVLLTVIISISVVSPQSIGADSNTRAKLYDELPKQDPGTGQIGGAPRLRGAVDAIGDACELVGIELSSKTFPSVVKKVNMGDSGYRAGLQAGDRVLSAEVQGNIFELQIERDNHRYSVKLGLSSEYPKSSATQGQSDNRKSLNAQDDGLRGAAAGHAIFAACTEYLESDNLRDEMQNEPLHSEWSQWLDNFWTQICRISKSLNTPPGGRFHFAINKRGRCVSCSISSISSNAGAISNHPGWKEKLQALTTATSIDGTFPPFPESTKVSQVHILCHPP